MKTFQVLCLTLLVFSYSAQAEITVGPQTPEQFATALIKASGLEATLAQMDEGFSVDSLQQQQAMQGEKKRLAPHELERLAYALQTSLNSQKLKKNIHAYITEKVDIEMAKDILIFLKTPLAQKFTDAEMKMSSNDPEIQQELLAYFESGALAQVSDERRDLIEALDEAAQVSDLMIDMVQSMMSAMAAAASNQQKANGEDEAIVALQRIEEMRPQLLAVMKPGIMATLAFSYKDMTDAELQKYTDFYKTPAGRHYTGLVYGGMRQAFTKSSADLILNIIRGDVGV